MSDKTKPVIETGAVYSRQEAAEALGISERAVRRAIAQGDLAATKQGDFGRLTPVPFNR